MNIRCVISLSPPRLSDMFLFLTITQHVRRSVLSDFNLTKFFSTDLRRSPQKPNFVKKPHVRAELFHTERRTDGEKGMAKLIAASRNLNAPKIVSLDVKNKYNN
jgi:hypothetical protein